MNLLADLAELLEDEGVAHRTDPSAAGGWKLAIDATPAEPDLVVKLGHSGGPGPREKNATIRQPQVQVLVRAGRHGGADARSKMQEVFDVLHNLPRQVLGTSQIVSMRVFGEVLFLGLDDKRRPELALNFITTTGG